jgi:hypothetical protein
MSNKIILAKQSMKNLQFRSLFIQIFDSFFSMLLSIFHSLKFRLITRRFKYGNEFVDCIVSLTSYGERLSSVHHVIYSLLNQSVRPVKIILNISFADEHLVSEKIKQCVILQLIEIHFCEDLKSYKKLIPTLNRFPEHVIITADDDVFYPSDWLKVLWNAHLRQPQSVICLRAHRINFTSAYKPDSYRSWDKNIQGDLMDGYVDLMPVGIGGILYPISSLHSSVFNKERFLKLSPFADDLWFFVMASLNGTRICKPKYVRRFFPLLGSQKVALFHSNVAKDGNDFQLRKILEEYNIWN